jgi:hypothetical protein
MPRARRAGTEQAMPAASARVRTIVAGIQTPGAGIPIRITARIFAVPAPCVHLVRQMQPPFVRPNPSFVAFRLFALRRAAIMARMLRDARDPEALFFPGNAAARVLPLLFLNPLSDVSALLLVRGPGALVYRSRFLPRVLGVHRCPL